MKKLCYLLALGSAFLWAKPYTPLEMNQLLVEKDGKHSINFSVLPQYKSFGRICRQLSASSG